MSDGRTIDHETASATFYDAVIVGSGVSGAIIANELARNDMCVLILEAGPGEDLTIPGYETYLNRFYSATSKDNNAPYPANPNAPMPRSTDARRITPGEPDDSSYLVQNGPYSADSTYTRVVGGTTMHWEGKTLRMLPDDFALSTRYGRGLDWPVGYDDLKPFYRRAEHEIGVSGNVEDQCYLGIEMEPDYVFPMKRMPLSYLDELIAKEIDGSDVRLGGEDYAVTVRSTPQGRNGIPNPDYRAPGNDQKGYIPVGAVSEHQADQGGRCQGNINCTPLCPVQAKYGARKTLAKALGSENGRVDLLPRTVASRVHVDPVDRRISHIEYKAYGDLTSPEHTTGEARGRIFVLAANAIENPRLLLASGLPSSSGLVGRNLMDHAYLLTWGLMPEIAGTMRGTQCTAGIEELRTGPFRRHQAAFRIGIHNDGWGWATGAPYTDLLDIVDNKNAYGRSLRRSLVDRISRQLLLACMVETLPNETNRVTVDSRYKDNLGNLRPVVSFDVPDYTMAGIAAARQVSRQLFQRLGAEDHTTYDTMDAGFKTYEGEGYAVRGGNHQGGTHIMGSDATNSVVDSRQRSWDHENLYLVGAGSMPTIGTANTTLTLAALCFSSADQIVAELKRDTAPIPVTAS